MRRIIGVGRQFEYQLPEVFAGFPRAETSFPISYPTAARPQAWAAGTPVLLLQTLLGLEPDRRRQALVSRAQADLPSWAGTCGSPACRPSTATGTSRSRTGGAR